MSDIVEKAFLAALKANVDRPVGIDPEDVDLCDGYVLGLERAAICVAKAFDREDLIEKWL